MLDKLIIVLIPFGEACSILRQSAPMLMRLDGMILARLVLHT